MLVVVWDEQIGRMPIMLNLVKRKDGWCIELFEMPPDGQARASLALPLVDAADGIAGDLRWLVDTMRRDVVARPAEMPEQWVGGGDA